MKIRIKNLLVAVLALAMFVTGSIGTDYHVKAKAGDIKITGESEFTVKPGETFHIKLPVIATFLPVLIPNIDITAANTAPFTFTEPSMSMNSVPVNAISIGASTDLEFDVKVKESAEIGNYPVQIKFEYMDNTDPSGAPLTCSITINLRISEEKIPAQLTIGHVTLKDSNIGSKTDLSFTVQNEGEISAKNTYVTMNFGDSIAERYTATKIKVGDLASGETKDITLPISILSTTTAGTATTTGRKTLIANFTYKTEDGDELTNSYNVYVNLTAVTTDTQTPKLNIEDMKFSEGLKPGDQFTMSVALQNIGGAEAKNIAVTVEGSGISTAGILKNYYMDGIAAEDMNKGVKASVDIPLLVSKDASDGLKEVKVIVTYTDETGTAYSINDTVYVDVVATTPDTGKPNLIISNVSQNPAQPMAGEKVEISFDLENKSSVDATELKIATAGLSEATFIPVKSEPYQYYELLKGGDKVRVTIPLIVSKLIPEGMNNITVSLTYNGGTTDSAIIPVKDVLNESGTISKPKLIVSQYTTDVEELRAGSTFNFTFDLYNTNSTVAAKNITVTVTQPDNIFSVTKGSNSFFINKMDPGETVSNTLEMKVKSDASTKTYQVEILIEYEYDGAEPNPQTGEIGEKRTEKLNLQAVENSRPVINNVNVYSYDGMVTVGNSATLAMEFYNMGRSPLNNVAVTVEGDFTKSDGNMYFIGNVAEGSSSYVEFDVIPNIEGTANGVLRVTFEDSNGDPVEITQDFTSQVNPAGNFDPGTMDPGSGEVFNPDVATAKKAIVPMWAFIIIQIVIFILFVPITRKIIISVYKSKLRRKEQGQY